MADYERMGAVRCLQDCAIARRECPKWGTSGPFRIHDSGDPQRAENARARRRAAGRPRDGVVPGRYEVEKIQEALDSAMAETNFKLQHFLRSELHLHHDRCAVSPRPRAPLASRRQRARASANACSEPL